MGAAAAQAQFLPLRGYLSAHDPSTVIPCKNRYYIFSTGGGIVSKSSADKIFWSPGPAVFTNLPAWTTSAVPGFDGTFWAPDLVFFDGQYHLYYAVSTFGSQVSAIGLATSPTLDPSYPMYKWTDQGPVITSTNGSAFNTIDPSFSWDNAGNLWMAFGSYWNGIYLVQLDSTTGLRISPNSPTYHVAYHSSIEASYLWRRGGYYYLFVNWGSCCSGVNSTYNIRVGRSTSITGPYLDRTGVDLVNGGGSMFMQANGKYTGPGHVGILSEGGALSLTHHYYDANAWGSQYGAYGAPDFAMLQLRWTSDDWPLVTNDWSAIYNFQTDARDEHGQYYGLLQNGATTVADATYGRALNLNGTNQYVWLPPGVAYGQTFVAVVNWRGGAPWQRIFDFGFDTTRTVMMTPTSDANVLRCDVNPGGNLQTIQWTKPLPTNVWTQVALTLDGSQGVLYVNGLPVVTNTGMYLLPLSVAPQTNHLGRSKFSADPYFNGEIAAFRAYGRALSPAEIAAPIPVISQPSDGTAYWPGSTINFSGSATDFASRPLNVGNLSWRIQYVQDGRTNVVFGPVSGANAGSFVIPTNATGGGCYVVMLTATDSSNRQSTATVTLAPANPPGGWSSYYPLTANAADVNSHCAGVLHGGASFVADPARGNVLNLNGSGQYVSFPPGLAGMKTFLAWVYWNGGGAWQRIFDFGNDTSHYTVLTPLAANGKLRFNISVNSTGGEQIADAPAALPTNVWTHVAVVMNGTSVVLYTNGAPVATNLFANLLPADLAATNLYLGKSQWPADPYFAGRLSAVRAFSRALTPAEIVGPQITLTQPAQGAIYRPGDVVAFVGGARDFYDAPIGPSGLTWSVSFINGGTTNLVSGPINGATNGTFSIPASGAAATNGHYQVTLTATDSIGRVATNAVNIYPAASAAPSSWAAYYPFISGAQDASNIFNGTLRNGASIVNDATRGNVLNLTPSSSQYVSLPAGAGAARTVSGWVKWMGGRNWQRIFDFGQSTSDFYFLTPSDASSLPQCAITPNGGTYTQTIESPVPFPSNQWTHVAVVMDGRQGMLYFNGQAVAVNNSVNLLPSDLALANNYFGRSEFSADPYFNGRLSAMRLNSSALPLTQIIAPIPVISQPATGSLFAGGSLLSFVGVATDYTGASLAPSAFNWNVQLYSNGMATAVLPLAGATNGLYLVPTNLIGTTNLYYAINLTVTDTNGNQQTAAVSVLPQTSILSLQTIPNGLVFSLDGQSQSATSFVAVVGMSRTLAAPSPQNLAGTNYQFVLWSDGALNPRQITVPPTNAIFTASFIEPTLGLAAGTDGVSLSWPWWAGAMNLVTASNLVPPVTWSPMLAAPVLSNGALTVTLPGTNQDAFFRLQSQ